MRWFVLMIMGLLPASAVAQSMATLIADRVEIADNSRLIATGHIEVFHEGDRLKAQRIVFDRTTDSLTIDGPITLTTQTGETVIFADSAQMSQDLRNGVLRSARLVLDQQLQLAAAEINRVNGRYTQLYKTVASSCQVCAARPVPLWQVRAEQVIHDAEAQQLYFHNARFEVAGVPILYLPRLRFPDPTLDRATGFLAPEIRSTDALGFGLKIPYFIKIGDHKDLTLTPYFAANQTRTLEARYRQAFRFGKIELNMAASRDDIRPGEVRSYLFGTALFNLPRDFTLSFDVETVSDSAYLLDYGYSDKDRLDSAIQLTRTKRDSFFDAELIGYRSLRTTESNQTAPGIVADVDWTRRFRPALIGGVASVQFGAHSHYRRSDLNIDGPDADTEVDGRDVSRLNASVDWRRDWVARNGMVWAAMGALDLDHTVVSDDLLYPDPVTHLAGAAGVELRWPFVKSQGGVSHVIEPIAQLIWSEDTGAALPNDESTLLEFDEGNLFSFSRFPGGDQHEQGIRANLGVSWTRFDPAGWSMGVTVGRIVRQKDLGQFAGYPSLAGDSSDWMAAVQVALPGKLQLVNRALFDDSFRFDRNELRLTYASDTVGLGGSYIWMAKNTLENRVDDVSELTMDARYRVNQNWLAALDYRFDFESNTAASAELGLEYRNECVTVDLSLSRRFTSSTSVEPTTSFGLSVALAGFGKGDGDRPKRRKGCR